jgi:hypothetical protein
MEKRLWTESAERKIFKNMIKTRVQFNIPEKMLLEPILYTFSRQFNIKTAVYMSEMIGKEGTLKLEIEGEEKQIEAGITWATEKGIRVKYIK